MTFASLCQDKEVAEGKLKRAPSHILFWRREYCPFTGLSTHPLLKSKPGSQPAKLI